MASKYIFLLLVVATLASANDPQAIKNKLSKNAEAAIGTCFDEAKAGSNSCVEMCIVNRLNILNDKKQVLEAPVRALLAIDNVTAAQLDQRAKKCANVVNEVKNCDQAKGVFWCIADDY